MTKSNSGKIVVSQDFLDLKEQIRYLKEKLIASFAEKDKLLFV